MKYRPEIDGLRAVAVLSVILYHAGFLFWGHNPFQGGFVGVDVFFVISGYLITNVILQDAQKGRFSLFRFYERRARRILPALYFVLFVSFGAAWFLLLSVPFRDFSNSLLATLLYFSNYYFLAFVDYFHDQGHRLPLLHTWSLSVEEQFYILFPFLLVFLWRKKPRLTARFFLLVAIASLALADWTSRKHAGFAFYSLPTRGWELLAGALLAVQEGGKRWPFTLPSRWRPALTSFGLALILGSVALMSPALRHPSFFTLACVLGASLVVAFAGGRDGASRLLASRPFVGIGLISYSLYLWHYPLFAFADLYKDGVVSPEIKGGLFALAIGLAVLSWRFVERPFRDRTKIKLPLFLVCLALASGALLSLGLAGRLTHGFALRFPPFVRQLEDETNITGFSVEGKDCFHNNCIIGVRDGTPSLALKGDSHAGMLTTALHEALLARGKSGLTLADGDLLVSHYPAFYPNHDKNEADRIRHEKALADPHIKTIILSARTTMRLSRSPFDNREGGIETHDVWTGGWADAEEQQALAEAILGGIRKQLADGKRIVLIYPVPEVGFDVPRRYIHQFLLGRSPLLSTSYAVYKERNKEVFALYDSLGENRNLLRIYPDRLLCDSFIQDRCATFDGQTPLYFDNNHLTTAAARLLVQDILDKATQKWGGLD